MDSQSVGTMADRFDFHIGRNDQSLDGAVALSADITEYPLDNFALEAPVFDLCQVDIAALIVCMI
jgi:hypothetical protein